MSVYRAYGQLRRGTGPWRTPFVIPVGDLVAPTIWPASYVSVDTAGPGPDLRMAMILDRFNSLSDMAIKFRIQRKPSITLDDITLRIMLLKSSDGFFVDSGDYHETDVSFAVLQYRVASGVSFPDELEIRADLGVHQVDARVTDVTAPLFPNPPLPPTNPADPSTIPAKWCSSIELDVTSTETDPLAISGGLVSGNILELTGVQTDYQPFNVFDPWAGGNYHEDGRQLRGFDMAWADGPGALPPSATWVDATATNPTVTASSMHLGIFLPQTGAAPTGTPVPTVAGGGQLRTGTYRYRLVYVAANGNESPAGPRSAPVTIDGSSANRTVHLSAFPPPPDTTPQSDSTQPWMLRIYRTDPDLAPVTGPDADPNAGDRGDDVLVAQLPLTTTSFNDTGVYNPADPGKPGSLRTDLMLFDYRTPVRMSLMGGVRLIDGTAGSDVRYGARLDNAPTKARVVYQPGTDPLVRWDADARADRLGVDLLSLDTPLGTGVRVAVESVAVAVGVTWTILGSEFFQLGLAAADRIDPSAIDPNRRLGRASAQIGAVLPPAAWPLGDADITAELFTAAAPRAGTSGPGAGALIALSDVQLATVTSGARAWADRDAAVGMIAIDGRFAARRGHFDRTVRVTRRDADTEAMPLLDLSAHLAPARVGAQFRFADGLDPMIRLGSRLRFLRGNVKVRSTSDTGETTAVDGTVFLDDTTERLLATVGDNDAAIELDRLVRLGGRVAITPGSGGDAVVVRPDVAIPPRGKRRRPGLVAPSVKVTGLSTGDVDVAVASPGVSGRAAVSFGSDGPVAVRANPQVKVRSHGDAESTTGLRALTARWYSLRKATVPRALLSLSATAPAPGDVSPSVTFGSNRPNTSLRVEAQERESRVAYGADSWAPAGVRSWLRARTAHLPQTLTATAALVPAGAATGFSFGGLAVNGSEAWGEGVLWAEPSAVWTDHVTDTGTDRGIGLLTAGFASIPAQVEAWMLQHEADLSAHVAAGAGRPTVGDPGSWAPGGVMLRVNAELALSNVMVALPTGDGHVCRTDGGTDTPAWHGTWVEVLAPFITLSPTTDGVKSLTLWSTGDPAPAASGPPPDPCNPPDPPDLASVIGWSIDPELRATMAVRLYELNTPTGVVVPRWWSMPTSDEEWEDVDDPRCGIWYLTYDVQMKDYSNTVAVYTAAGTDNPFGNWEDGPGQWWLRARDQLEFIIPSGDVYMGNVGGGFHVPFTNGIYSTLPAIFNWSYP